MKNKYNSNNPGFIISYILSKMHEEINYDKDNKINYIKKYNEELIKKEQNIISKDIFITQRITNTCQKCKAQEYYYVSKPIIDLFIQEEDKLTEVKKGNFKNMSLKDYFLFLLNDKIDVNEKCVFCNNKLKSNNFIEILNNNIIIVYVNRDKDKNYSRDLDYEKKIKFKDFNNIEYTLISVLIMNINVNNNKDPKNNNNMVDNYYTFFKNFGDNKWYEYNNGKINILDNRSLIINKKYAHLLIYQKV
jgi:hypothetical protein